MTDRQKRLRRGLKLGLALAVAVPLIATLTGYAFARAGLTVTANLTPSVPVGLYLARRGTGTIERGQIVAFAPHNDAAAHGFREGWMKPGSRYIKRVGAITGDMVCVDQELTIRTAGQGTPPAFIRVGPVAERDHSGKALPHLLAGCQRVPPGHFLPIGDGLPNSYDGRYYGFVPVAGIEATLRPIWTGTSTDE